MRRLITLLALAFTLALVPAIPAQAKKPLNCELYMEVNWDGPPWGPEPYTWMGTVWGDINGDFYVILREAIFPGMDAHGMVKTEHFVEEWIIENTTEGWMIGGFDEGVWSIANLKWVANGRVTSATGPWSHLVGSNMQYSGTTTEFPVPPGTPVSATGRLKINMRP